ncbi:NAD(P)/FAD-dependent oxidoreductase [Nocardia stercoris]|uniref:NAD(P)/FAD-dependent oxidoreductase n=1 Tax=Nocardia stercoris TaxID=2483361 RepID=UPI001F45C22F|nr:FAD-dependent oxidoreductase [Nocardia stercoris]
MNTTDIHEIVVLGAGYTGMIATASLAHRTRKLPVRITLVNPSDRFTERLRMHQIATGRELADHRIPALLAGTGVEFHRAAATSVDPEAQLVTLDSGTTLRYDTLVYALGSTTDTSAVPGADHHAWTLNDPRSAHRLAGRLAEIAAGGGTVTVCGGGLTGIEAATEIAESFPELTVTMISAGEIGAMMGEKARAHLNAALDRLGIVRRTGLRATKVLPDAVELDNGELVDSDLTLWTTGVRVSPWLPTPESPPTQRDSSSRTRRCARCRTRTSTPSATRRRSPWAGAASMAPARAAYPPPPTRPWRSPGNCAESRCGRSGSGTSISRSAWAARTRWSSSPTPTTPRSGGI